MNYALIREICRVNKISIGTLCKEIGMSMDGLKRGMDNGGLAVRYVLPLCNALCITPNKLFGVPEGTLSTAQTQNGGVGNTQIMESGMAALSDQLREKDAQISRLLGIIENKN